MSSADFIPRLGVNIDHVATLRELRGTPYPDLLEAARLVEEAGAKQITVHLREDRRHIQGADVLALKREKLNVLLNLEMAVAPEIVRFALKVIPDWACLVPEKRHEVTTEGGLDLKKSKKKISQVVSQLKKRGVQVSLFVEPTREAVKLSKEIGADAVELHTGAYAIATQNRKQTATTRKRAERELKRIREAALYAKTLGIRPHAGHGLDYNNLRALVDFRDEQGQALLEEYNIGHSIVCRAAMVGMLQAVREMVSLIEAP